MARRHAGRFSIRLEGVEIHHALEAPEREILEQHRADGEPAFEFRHKSWYEAPIFDVLRDRNIALCLSDHHDAPAPWELTASHVYIRGHGPGGRYRDHYSDRTLRDWARFIARCRRQGREIFCYFDNDQKSAAPADALRLMGMVGKPAE